MSAKAARVAPLVLAASGGAFYFLSYLGWGLWPLCTLFLVPFWRALETAPGWRRAALLGFVFGAAAYAGGYPWLWALVETFFAERLVLGALAWTAHGIWFAAGFAAYALLRHALRRRGRSVAFAGVVSLLVVEWLQPQLFPVNAGAALATVVPLVQIADLGGPLLLTAFVGGANAAAYGTWCWLRGEGGAPVAGWIAAALAVAAVLGYGELRARQVARAGAAEAPLVVGLVQADLGAIEKRTRPVLGHRRHLEQSRALLAEGALDLLVWPETAYTRGLRRPLPVDGQPVRAELEVPLLFGATSVFEQDGRRVTANSALLVSADGTIHDAYDKNLLIPLAERIPLAGWLPSLAARLPHVQDFRAAREVPALRLGDLRISTPICYEVIVAGFVRRMVREARPHLLVTLANDAWFGDSQEPWIHLGLARLRAVEHRLWLVRATNSGISAFVDPTGRLVAHTGVLSHETLRATVYPLDVATLYARAGDWPGPIAAVAAIFALACPRRAVRGAGPDFSGASGSGRALRRDTR